MTKSPEVVKTKETILKKRKSILELKDTRTRNALKNQKNRKQPTRPKAPAFFVRPSSLVSAYKKKENQRKLFIRNVKTAQQIPNDVADTTSIVLARRTIDDKNIAIPSQSILKKLRLNKANTGVFLKETSSNRKLLAIVAPYVTLSYPTKEEIAFLLHSRAFAKVKTSRLPISDNALIERHLGSYDILCVEDIVHELATGGPNFDAVNNFLWPFRFEVTNDPFGNPEKLKAKG
jgi:large subunit ribosomal protein L7e